VRGTTWTWVYGRHDEPNWVPVSVIDLRPGRTYSRPQPPTRTTTNAAGVGTGGTGCTSSAWTCTSIDTVAGGFHRNRIVFDKSEYAVIRTPTTSNEHPYAGSLSAPAEQGCEHPEWSCTKIHDAVSICGRCRRFSFRPGICPTWRVMVRQAITGAWSDARRGPVDGKVQQ